MFRWCIDGSDCMYIVGVLGLQSGYCHDQVITTCIHEYIIISVYIFCYLPWFCVCYYSMHFHTICAYICSFSIFVRLVHMWTDKYIWKKIYTRTCTTYISNIEHNWTLYLQYVDNLYCQLKLHNTSVLLPSHLFVLLSNHLKPWKLLNVYILIC
jgi:hypothetical protein